MTKKAGVIGGMDMEDHKREQEELIKSLKKQLDWYTFEAETDEMNLKKINSILELLKELEPLEDDYFNPEKGLERFWKYYERRQAEENAGLNSLKEEEDKALEKMLAEEENASGGSIIPQEVFVAVEHERQAAREKKNRPEEPLELETKTAIEAQLEKGGEAKKKEDRLLFFRRHKGATGTIAAALVVMTILVSGSVGAYAEKDTGFFHWLKKDETGSEMIISPTTSIDTNMRQPERYESFANLPEEYADEVWSIDIPLDDLNFQYIEVIKFNSYTEIVCYYKDTLKKDHLEIGVTIYDSKVMIEKDKFDNYVYYDEKLINNIPADLFVKESEDEIEHAICFYNDVKAYSVRGNVDVDRIENVIARYSEYIFD